MKINWFTALSPARSASARLTRALLPHLAQTTEVVIWSHQPESEAEMKTHAEVRLFNPAKPPWREFNRATLSFFLLENDCDASGPIWAMSRLHPGIVILHGLTLQHLLTGLVAQNRFVTVLQYLALAEFHHPGSGRTDAELYLHGEIGIDQLSARCPLIGAASENALAVIVQSPAEVEQLSREAACPVVFIPPGPPNATATALVELAENVERYEALWAARRISRRVGEALSLWCSESEAATSFSQLSRQIEDLCSVA